jgi:eukaryotic-like serine/threonine-protein kinase
MGLTGKILLFTAALVVAVVGGTLAFTALEADRLARATIETGLGETRDAWAAIRAEKSRQLKLGVRVLANDPYFKAALAERDHATTLDSLGERGQDLGADLMLATDGAGVLVARTDRPSAGGDDLSADPLVDAALDGEESATVWRQGDRLFTAVAVPMQTGPELLGVLLTGFAIDEAVATQLRRQTRSEIAYILEEADRGARIAASSLGTREAALLEALARLPPDGARVERFEVDLAGDRHIGVRIPLLSASGEEVGAALALRSLAAETASFRRFRNSLVLVSLGVMVVGLLAAWGAAARVTGPLRRLVGLVEGVRDGTYRGSVPVQSADEIGALARAFNALLADLREKEQMISFLREGMTAMRQAVSATTPTPGPATGGGDAGATLAL